MPDNLDEQSEKELEKLFEGSQDAEPEVNAPPPPLEVGPDGQFDIPNLLSVPAECKLCGKPTRVVCPTCHTAHCEEHESNVDPRYCKICLDEPALELRIESGVKDADGVTHPGRHIEPVGPMYKTLAQRISEMSIKELESYIDYYKELVKQAEKSLDVRRIILGVSQVTLGQKQRAERRKLRAMDKDVKRYVLNADGSIPHKVTVKNTSKESPLSGLGISGEKLAAMLANLPNAKKPDGGK